MSYLGTLNSLLTSTTSRYASLRRNILSSSSEDDTNLTDPSSSHVSRVLRAYYTEKALPFPPWLGPDPRDAARTAQSQPQAAYTTRPLGSLRNTSTLSTTSAGSGSGSQPASRAGGLSDIWGDASTTNNNNNGGVVEERGSLRRGPLGGGRRGDRGQEQGSGSGNVRPLPSQRVGSYQTREQGYSPQQQMGEGRPPGSSGSVGGTVQERLKARLGKGGSGSGRSTPEGEEGGGGGGGSGRGSYATQGLSGWQGRR